MNIKKTKCTMAEAVKFTQGKIIDNNMPYMITDQVVWFTDETGIGSEAQVKNIGTYINTNVVFYILEQVKET